MNNRRIHEHLVNIFLDRRIEIFNAIRTNHLAPCIDSVPRKAMKFVFSITSAFSV